MTSQSSASGNMLSIKDVIFAPHYEVTIVSTRNVELSLYLVVVVGIAPVRFHIIPIIDETEALVSSTQIVIGLILFAAWALKKIHTEKKVTFSAWLLLF